MDIYELKDVRESSDGERVNFKIRYRHRWTMAAISRSALSQFSATGEESLVDVFERERERIARAAHVRLTTNPTLEPVLVGTSDF
jgi:hypothetical protein